MILIFEDDKIFRDNLCAIFSRHDIPVETSSTPEEAIYKIQSFKYQIIFVDLYMDGRLVGIDIVKEAKKHKIENICVLSACDNNENIAKEVFKEDIYAYYKKDNFISESKRYLRIIKSLLKASSTKDLIFDDYQKKFLKNLSKKLFHDRPILILGEEGVGKCTFAKYIHNEYSSGGNFVIFDCELVEGKVDFISELLGDTNNTKSTRSKNLIGKLLLANNGSIYFKNVHKLSKNNQTFISNIIRERSFLPKGQSESIPLDTLFFFSSPENEDTGCFIDMYFSRSLKVMLSGQAILIKPLREKPETTKEITRYYINKSTKKYIVDKSAFEILDLHEWALNITEVRDVVREFEIINKNVITDNDVHEIIKDKMYGSSSSLNFLPNINLAFIKKHGLSEYISSIENVVVKYYKERNISKNEIMKILKLSKSTYYRIEPRIYDEK